MKFKIFSISLILILITALGLILGFNWEAIKTNLTKGDLYTESQVVKIKKDIEDKYKSDIENYLLKINNYEETIESQMETLNENKETIFNLKKQGNADKNRISELESENQRLSSSLDEKIEELINLEDMYNQLNARFISLQQSSTITSREYEELQEQFNSLNGNYTQLQSQYEQLNSMYNNLLAVTDSYDKGYFDGVNILTHNDFSEEENKTLNTNFRNAALGGKSVELTCAYKNLNSVIILYYAMDGRRVNYYNYFIIDVSSLGSDFKLTKQFLLEYDITSDQFELTWYTFNSLSSNTVLDEEFKSQYTDFNLGSTIFEERSYKFDEIFYFVEQEFPTYKNCCFLIIDRNLPFVFKFELEDVQASTSSEEVVKNQLIELSVNV